MRHYFIALIAALTLAASTKAAIPRNPDFSLRWDQFSSVLAVDSFVIGTAPDGMMVFRRGSDLSLSPLTPYYLNSTPINQKRFGSVLVVQTAANLLDFFDLTAMPNLNLLGQVDLGVPINDLVLRGNDLYISRGFDGLFRYRLNNYSSAIKLDSSTLGVHYLGLQVSGDTLLALDDYNGVLFYQFQDTGFARFENYLYLPFQVSSFLKQDSMLAMSVRNSQLYVARFRPSGPVITDTVNLLVPPQRIMASGSTFVLFDPLSDLAQVVDVTTGRHGSSQLLVSPDSSLRGEIVTVGQTDYALFALAHGGIGYFNVDSLSGYSTRPILGLKQDGQVTGLKFVNGKLFVGSSMSPVQEYDLGSNGDPGVAQTLFSSLDRVSGMDAVGDSLFVTYPQIRRTVILKIRPDSIAYGGAFFVDTSQFSTLRFNAGKVDTFRSAFLLGESTVGMYAITDSGAMLWAGSFNVVGRIRDVAFSDSVAAVLTNKGIWLERIFNDFSVEYRNTIGFSDNVYELMPYGHDLVAFNGASMVRLTVTDPYHPKVDTLLQLPWGIAQATQVGRLIYAVGQQGICVIDAGGATPALLDAGGRGGYFITAANGIVAISDSNRVHLYNLAQYPTPVAEDRHSLPTEFALGQNYPNPFNPSTNIEYRIPTRGQVELTIFNVLGQRVTTLVDNQQAAGSYRVQWNGTDGAGSPVATGVYFYMLRSGNYTFSKKMLLLK